MSDFERLCPECEETLSREAKRCACGWGAKSKPQGKQFDMRCTFKSGTWRCEYPVGMFLEGATSGWCVFHRQAEPSQGAEIVRQSGQIPYKRAIQAIVDRNADNLYGAMLPNLDADPCP